MYCRHTLITNDKVPNFLLILNYLLYINDLKSKYFFGKNLQEYSFFFWISEGSIRLIMTFSDIPQNQSYKKHLRSHDEDK